MLTFTQISVKKYKYSISMRPRKRSWKNRPHEPVTRRVAALMVSGMAERKTVSPGSPAGIRAQKDGVEQRAYVGTEHDLEDLCQYLIRLSMDRRV